MKNKTYIYKIVLVALFAALCFVGTMVQIPLPSGGMVHLGNFFCILAALLCGGIIGGLAGGIGCGLYDLIIYSSPVGMVQYFILKFLMGFLVGGIFRMVIKKEKKNYLLHLSIYGICLAIITTLILILHINNLFKLSSSITNVNLYIGIVVFIGYLFSLLIIMAALYSSKLKNLQKSSLYACTLAIIANIVFEFIAKIIVNTLVESLTFEAALIKAYSGLPSCILTGCLSVIVVSIIYPKAYKATKNINWLNDLEGDLYEE